MLGVHLGPLHRVDNDVGGVDCSMRALRAAAFGQSWCSADRAIEGTFFSEGLPPGRVLGSLGFAGT